MQIDLKTLTDAQLVDLLIGKSGDYREIRDRNVVREEILLRMGRIQPVGLNTKSQWVLSSYGYLIADSLEPTWADLAKKIRATYDLEEKRNKEAYSICLRNARQA